ncbi:MAG: hypothetical protein K2Q18_03630 [Bdellovibrionales bacterium]|nr:hypothetical protein [Bdellovibrionales bacterium]
MSDSLKRSLKKKMAVAPSSDFDSKFFAKLEKEKRPSVFSNWLTWAVSGCATASVLFIAINNYNQTHRGFDHKEYVEAAMEIQNTMTEDISTDDMIDLTTSSSDEI